MILLQATHFSDVSLAYLDPGTGSLVLQVLLASVFGAAFALRTRVKQIVGRLFGRKSGSDEPEIGSPGAQGKDPKDDAGKQE